MGVAGERWDAAHAVAPKTAEENDMSRSGRVKPVSCEYGEPQDAAHAAAGLRRGGPVRMIWPLGSSMVSSRLGPRVRSHPPSCAQW